MNSDDDVLTFLLLVGGAALVGPALLAQFVPTVAAWFVETGILTTKGVVIPIGDAGLDLGRIIVLAALVLLLLLGVVVLVRARARRQSTESAR